jgi:hypothetical protein
VGQGWGMGGVGGCQLSRYEDEPGDLDRSDLVYAAISVLINWPSRSSWMHRRGVSQKGRGRCDCGCNQARASSKCGKSVRRCSHA